MDHEALTIGQVATGAGVHVETLRYYERRGLVKEPRRRPSGYRAYPADTVRLIRFIKRAQELGFTLHEVQDLLRLRGNTRASCAEVREAARAKMADIDQRVRSLRAMKRALEVLVASCRSDGSARECPILEALDDTTKTRGQS